MTTLILHSALRWLILIAGFWTVINAISGISQKRTFSANDNKSSLFFMIVCDLQLLLGLILVFTNGWFDKIKAGMGDVMKDPVNRFFIVEHGIMMILAWVLVHVGRSAVKKAAPEKKHKKMLLLFGIALFLILLSIPWTGRPNVGRPMMRWF